MDDEKEPIETVNEQPPAKLNIAVGVDKETFDLVIKFSSPVEWVSFKAEEAINFSNLLRAKAQTILDGLNTKPVDEG